MTQTEESKPIYSPEELQPNSFNLIGRICKFQASQTHSGNLIIKLSISKKVSCDTYDLFVVTFFDTDKNTLASNISAEFEEKDYIGVKGYFRINKYIPKNSDKERWEVQFIGTDYQKVVFDNELNKFVKAA